MDVGKLQITVDLNADDLAAEITKAVEKQLEPVLAKIREQINATARDLNKIDGKKFIEVAVDAKAAQKAVDEQGRASAKAAAENEANAKALRDLAKAEAEFAAAQKSGDLAQRSLAMSRLTQAMKDYETATGRSASQSRDYATQEVKNLDTMGQAAERRSTVSARTARAQVANNKAVQDALNKTAEVAEKAADRRVKAEQRVRDEVDKTEKRLDDAAKREAERMAARAAGGGGGGSGGGGGGGGSGGGTGVYGGRNFVTRFAMNPVGANVIGLGLAGIPAATLAVTDLAAALGQLANAGLVIPGIFAGIGASVGTLAVGLSGMKKATSDLYSAIKDDDPKALKKANDELKDMAPAAKDTSMAIAQLAAGPLTDLRKSVQGKMFDGLAGEINQLGGVLIPHLTEGMDSIATSWNKTFKTIGATAMQGGNLTLMDQIFGNTAQAQTRADAAIAPLTHGLAQLSASGTAFLPRLADGVTKVSTRFDQFISKAAASGDLNKWIDSGLTGLTHLGDAAINFGKTLEGIFKADGSRNFLEWLDKATQRWAQFTNSARGQDQLKAFFKEAADDLHRWEPVLGNLFKLLGQIIGGAQAWSAVMLPFLQSASSLLLHMPFLVQGITAAFLAWRTISGVSTILTAITKLSSALDAVPAKAKAAGTAIAEMDVEDDIAGAAGGGAGGGGRGRGRSGRMGKYGRGAAAAGLFMGADQLMQGVDPGNQSGGGVGGWLQAIGGGALTGGSIGAFGGPELAAVGAALGGTIAAAIKGLESVFKSDGGDKPLVPGALTGQAYQNALAQQVMPGGPGGAPWNQQLIDQAVYGTSGSFDPRKSAFSTMTRGDANYQTVLAEMQKPGGAFSSIPGLTADNAADMLDKIVKQAHDASTALSSLGGEITDLPSGEVAIKDPTQAILDRIKKLGGDLHSLPSGIIVVDTSQLNAAQHQADDLAAKLAKIMVPGMQLSADGKGLIPAAPSASGPPGVPGSMFPIPGGPGFASGGIIRRFDAGGAGDPGGGSPWRVAAQIGSQFIDEATMVAIKMGQAAMKGGSGALGTAADVAGKVIGPLGIAAPFAMDAIDPQARTTGKDVTPLNRGKALPDSSFAGMLPGYTPGQDTMSLPLYGGGKYALSGGEGVVIPEAMAALGPDWLYGINSQFRPGLPKGNYASGGSILGRFAPGGQGGGGKGGPGMPFDPFRLGPSVDDPNNTTQNLLLNIRNLLGGTAYGPLTQMQYSALATQQTSQIQTQYLQQIASGGTLPGTLAPGTTPGHLGPWGSPVAPINKPEAMARGVIQAWGGNPDIIFGEDSVKRAQRESESIKQALGQAAGQPGGLSSLTRPTDPAAYTDALTKFAQTGVITPDMKAMGLDINSPVIGALQSARMEKGPDRANIPAYIAQSLAPGGYTGPLTDENKGLLGSLGTFREGIDKNALQRQQLNMNLSGVIPGGVAGLPAYVAQHPEVLGMVPGLMPTGGGAPGGPLAFGGGAGDAALSSLLQAKGLSPQMIRVIQGFSQVEGSNPAGTPTLGFTDQQLGGKTDLSSHVDALIKQFQDRSGVAGAFPENGTDQQQAQWIANVVGQSGAPSDWQGNAQPQDYVQRVVAAMGGRSAAAGAPPGGYPQMPPLLPAAGPAAPGAPAPTGPTLWPGGPPVAPVVPPPASPVVQPPIPPGIGGPPPGPAPTLKGMLVPPRPSGPPAPALAPVPVNGGGFWNPGPGATLDSIHQPGHPGWTFGAQAGPVLQGARGPAAPVAPPAPAMPGDPNDPRDNRPGGGGWLQEHPTGAVAAMPPVVPPPASPLVPSGIGGPPPIVPPPGVPAGTAGMPMPIAPPGGGAKQWWATPPGQPGGFNFSNLPDVRGAHSQEAYLFSAIQQQFPWAQLTAGNFDHPKDQGWHGKGQAIDVGGGNADQQAQLSNWLLQFAPQLEELIHQGPGVSQNVKSGKAGPAIDMPGSVYNTGQAGYHGDHVHIAVTDAQGQGLISALGGPVLPPGAIGAGGTLAGMPGTYPGSQGQFGAGGVFGGGGGVVPVMVTNWPGGGGGMFGGMGGAQGQQAAQMALGAAGPVLGAAGNVAGDVAGDAINATPGALQSVFETPAGINAPAVQTVSALNKHDPIQGLLAAAGINVPDMSRAGAVGLGGAQFEQGGAGTGGAAFDSEGRLLSATTGLYQRTSSDLNATLVAMRDQLVGATTDVGSKLTKTALTPLLKAGVSAGMGAIPSAVLAAMGTDLGTAMAPPIASAVSNSGSDSSTAQNLGDLPFTAGSGLITGLSTTFAASGGAMTGGMAGVDSIPVMAMPGEWMLTTDEVAKLGGFDGMGKFTRGLAKSTGVHYMASGGAVGGSSANPGTAGTGTASLGADFFGVSQIPILGPILDILINILLAMMGIQVTVRDTMLNLGDNFRQFRGDSFKAFDAQGRLLNDTSGLIDRTTTSTSEATAERVKILTDVLEGVITYIINKVVIPLSEAVAQAAINAAASAGGGALNAIAPGAGSAAGAAASALGDASVQITGQIATDFWGAAVPAIGDAIATSLLQGNQGGGLESVFGGYSWGGSAPTGLDTASLAGGLAGLLLPLIGLAGLGVVTGPGSGPGALFDSGGMATGIGMMPKATIEPERVLDPTTTGNFERLVDVLRGGGAPGNNTTTVHAPITVLGNAEAGQNVRKSLLSLMT